VTFRLSSAHRFEISPSSLVNFESHTRPSSKVDLSLALYRTVHDLSELCKRQANLRQSSVRPTFSERLSKTQGPLTKSKTVSTTRERFRTSTAIRNDEFPPLQTTSNFHANNIVFCASVALRTGYKSGCIESLRFTTKRQSVQGLKQEIKSDCDGGCVHSSAVSVYLRPYRDETSASRPIRADKHRRGQIILTWVTSRERCAAAGFFCPTGWRH
jgi:hypothetical protein